MVAKMGNISLAFNLLLKDIAGRYYNRPSAVLLRERKTEENDTPRKARRVIDF